MTTSMQHYVTYPTAGFPSCRVSTPAHLVIGHLLKDLYWSMEEVVKRSCTVRLLLQASRVEHLTLCICSTHLSAYSYKPAVEATCCPRQVMRFKVRQQNQIQIRSLTLPASVTYSSFAQVIDFTIFCCLVRKMNLMRLMLL